MDLKEERGLVSQTLMQMECIPAGMELFPATDEDQFEFIKKIIDDCDYYILIIGGRYGSVADEGISYTEKEFEYAVSQGIPVVALLHGSTASLPMDKSELDPVMRDRLEAFRKKAATGRLVKFWKSGDELASQVAISMVATMSRFPRVGWIRGSNVASEDLLREINDLRKENEALKKAAQKSSAPPDLSGIKPAGLDSTFTINGVYTLSGVRQPWQVPLTWEQIFYFISPYLIKPVDQDAVQRALHKSIIEKHGIRQYQNFMNDQDFQTVAVQMKVLGLIEFSVSQQGTTFWKLSPAGERLMYQLRVQQ
jgi:hypothetical protein